jgi:hypothetical protein
VTRRSVHFERAALCVDVLYRMPVSFARIIGIQIQKTPISRSKPKAIVLFIRLLLSRTYSCIEHISSILIRNKRFDIVYVELVVSHIDYDECGSVVIVYHQGSKPPRYTKNKKKLGVSSCLFGFVVR